MKFSFSLAPARFNWSNCFFSFFRIFLEFWVFFEMSKKAYLVHKISSAKEVVCLWRNSEIMWNRLDIMNSEFIMNSLSEWNVLQMLFIFLFRLFDSRTPKKLLGLGEVSNKRKRINISEWRKNEEKFQGSIFPFQRRELKNGSILMMSSLCKHNISKLSCHSKQT